MTHEVPQELAYFARMILEDYAKLGYTNYMTE